jgi:hypothetical protein
MFIAIDFISKKLIRNRFTVCLFSIFLLISCSPKLAEITMENTLDFERNGEMVEINTEKLPANFNQQPYLLKNEKGEEIAYQELTENKSRLLIFQATVPAKSKVTYTLTKGNPAIVAPKTYARYIPERKDDFAWENDLAAYRMYGPALANENPSNGVDLWLKCTDSLIVDKFYSDELKKGLSYHVNHGLGLDCYGVGHTMGAGGIAPYTSQLWIGNHYDRHETLVNGPLRSVFTLTYDSVLIDTHYYRQTITITVDAGSLLNKADVNYVGTDKTLKLAAGIVLHKTKAQTFSDKENRVIAYAENAVSDAGLPSGRNFVGVYAPESDAEILEEDNHLLILGDYQAGSHYKYYFGGGWNQWKFPDDKDWFDALLRFSKAKTEALKITVRF